MRDVKQIARQVHRKRSLAVLGGGPEFQWLAHRPEILDELGRIDSDHALLVLAKRLCELKPPPGEALEMISRHRDFNQLADEIVHVVNDYLRRNPSTARADILRALESAGVRLGDVDGSAKPGCHQFLHKMQRPATAMLA